MASPNMRPSTVCRWWDRMVRAPSLASSMHGRGGVVRGTADLSDEHCELRQHHVGQRSEHSHERLRGHRGRGSWQLPR